MNIPQPQPDPALVAQQQAAQAQQNQQIGQSLSDQQLSVLRQFGAVSSSMAAGLIPNGGGMFRGAASSPSATAGKA